MSTDLDERTEQFYRKTLPDICVDFTSRAGKRIFREALNTGYMDCYFKLAAQLRTQDEPAFCGLSTLVMVLNALSVDPGRLWKSPWRWFHESMLACCCTSLALVETQGVTFDQFVCLAESNCLIAKPTRAEKSVSASDFREVVKRVTSQEETILVSSFSRQELNQTGEGHFSPIGGYHHGRDLVLVLDTARFKYPPHWVPLTLMVSAMKRIDHDTGKPRGYVLLSRKVGDDQPKIKNTDTQRMETHSNILTTVIRKFVSFVSSKQSIWLQNILFKIYDSCFFMYIPETTVGINYTYNH